MHPAPSVILFTVLSGLGFGYLGFLALGAVHVAGAAAFAAWALGYALAVGGLVASTFHLGQPLRAWRAFTQWQTSWLSREAWASVSALLLLAPMALSDILGLGLPRALGVAGAVLCAVTVLSTGMIYAQLRSVPRWHHWITPVLFLVFAASGGAVLTAQALIAVAFLVLLAGVMAAAFHIGDGQFARRGATLGSATGLGALGVPHVFEPAHTAGNYLLREMIFVVGRRHVRRLRGLALLLGCLLPAILLLVLPAVAAAVLATAAHLAGALAARWLFFAEAEHVVGLYYGHHQSPAKG